MSFNDHEGARRASARASARNDRGLRGDTYALGVACTNCDYTGVVSLPKGQPFSDLSRECPGCGCRTLVKTMDRRPRLAHGV